MIRNRFSALIALVMLNDSTAWAVATYELTMSICEEGSSCLKCIERKPLRIDVDGESKELWIRGKDESGAPIAEKSGRCSIKSDLDWTCSSLRGEIESRGGKVSFRNTGKALVVEGRKLELCVK